MTDDTSVQTQVRSLPLGVTIEYSDRVNFAMQQNGVPLVEAVRISSESDAAVEDLSFTLAIENGDAEPWVGRVARIEPGATVSIRPAGFTLSAKSLSTRTEAERTSIIVTLALDGAETRATSPIDLLAFDQWPGVGHYPELTAAFVTPNHPTIADLLKDARESLRRLDMSDALDGYQSGSRLRSVHIAEACFNAVAARGIGYINPPASFETAGQRVRLVDRIAREKFGTCLDLSLLLMAMWEQCGLHPLVLLPEGHAMPALWTHEAHLPEAAIDEPARIRNLIELGEIVPVESTLVTQSSASFARAVDAAKRRMAAPGGAFCAIDIRSGRKRGIRPLPLRHVEAAGSDPFAEEEHGASTATISIIDPVALAERVEDESKVECAPAGQEQESGSDRISRWQTRLLDLSLRNRLLNFRETGRTVPLAVPDLAALEDKLADGGRFTIHPRTDGDEAFLREEMAVQHLYTSLPLAETQKRLLTLYRTAKSSIEETGANLLYLSLGLLKWYETESTEQARNAPLVLLPVQLKRAATGSGYLYTLALSDEPLRPNVTLLEKLRTQFGIETAGLDNLPEDESGLDVRLILRNFRAAIRESNRWEVVESASLGLFSFNKFLMWRDLQDNLDRLKANRLVAHLVDRPGQDFDSAPFPRAEELDDTVTPADLLCTRDADSSQLAAVRAAAERRTFVLEGPPGTGKSQTIANIIADGLARGHRVLFVAEKMAALTVVRQRLEKDGLGPFCLELHSAKASKKEVLAQLQQALDAAGDAEPADWDALCRDLAGTRMRLNNYVREMHRPRSTGESLYRVLGRLTLLGEGPTTQPPMSDIATTTAEHLGRWRALIADMQMRAAPVDPSVQHPLRGIGQSVWSFDLTEDARSALEAGIGAIERLHGAAEQYLNLLGTDVAVKDLERSALKSLCLAASLLERSPLPHRRLLTGNDAASLRRTVSAVSEIGRKRQTLRQQLLTRYREEFLSLDFLVEIDAVQRVLRQHAVIRFFTARSVLKRLRPYAVGDLPAFGVLLTDLETGREHSRLNREVTGRSDVADLLGSRWNGGSPSWDEVQNLLTWCEQLSKALSGLRATPATQRLGDLLAEAACSAEVNERARSCGRALVERWNDWTKAWTTLAGVLLPSTETAFSAEHGGWLEVAACTLRRWIGGLEDLNDWCAWRQSRDAAALAGLEDLVDLYERGGCRREELATVFERSFGQKWFNAVANGVEVVRSFNAEAHTDAIRRFRDLDKRLIGLTKRVVGARLKAAAPLTPSQASAQSEVGILRRELAKKRRHLPTRRLIEAMPTLLPRLKPCFLMSPLSVAQFLDTRLPPFDLVVFDEASQIPVWDSIGAIARGTEVIVVGDSKQLPPTNFFNTIDGEDESETEDIGIEDMESILNECTASGIPRMWLRWHYRSRHESLIAFSNHHYYQNELHTFPSPQERSEELGVTFRHVPDGVYDRGGSRTNRIEATQVVDEVVRMLRDSGCPDSIGIVTFNQAQQSLIEDLMDAKRRELPEIEPHFTSEVPEPVFIKNLENVQGDERDTIIFSVAYGADQTGRPSMNFGPLNKDGGERRLNVAVTRARKRLIVFSSLTADQIDLRRTRAVGVRHFKTFLDYASRGPQAIAEAVEHSGDRQFESGFEQAVWRALTDKGWEVDTQVGCAGYRIDLAVRHPELPGRYLVGIECDGASYHSAKTARDRDRLRQTVLEGLGWTIERVWSTEWRISPARCLARLERAIQSALNAPSRTTPTTAPPSPGGSSSSNDVEVESGDDDQDEPPGTDSGAAPATDSGLPAYVIASLSRRRLGRLDICSDSATERAVDALWTIVDVEAPITESLAMRRLADAFGVERIRERFRDRFSELARICIAVGHIVRLDGVLWSARSIPNAYDSFRVPSDDPQTARDLEDIPLPELTNAVVYTLRVQFGMPRDELAREVARLFGLQRMTTRVVETIGQAIDAAISRRLASESDGRVTAAEW